MQAEILADGKVILVPTPVQMPTGAAAAGMVFIAGVGVIAAVVAYSVGKDDGRREVRGELKQEFDRRLREIEDRAEKHPHAHGHKSSEART